MAQHWHSANGNAEFLEVPESPHGFTRFPTAVAAKTRKYARDWLSQQAQAEEI